MLQEPLLLLDLSAGKHATASGNKPAARTNRLLIGICAAVLIYLAAEYLFILASVPAFYRLVASGQVPTLTIGGQVTLSQALLAEAAAHRGLTLPVFGLFYVTWNFLIAAGFWGAGALVLWKAKSDWFHWFTGLVLVFYPSGNLWQISAVAYPVAAAYIDVSSILWPSFLLFLYLFPDGRAVPRWSRWPMAFFLLAHMSVQTLRYLAGLPGSPIQLPPGVERLFLIVAAALLFILFCQVYRYLRVADVVMRKQIQWFVAVLVLFAISTVIIQAAGGDTTSNDQGYWSDLNHAADLLLPIAITIAILRYRLWDIDIIIRRTLVYSVLTGLLALAYFGAIVVLQSIVRLLTGQGQQPFVTVISTLAIAALFVPLRRWVQSFIDRRFYRRKYDAAAAVAAFAATARDEVDLSRLTGHLNDVVRESLEPAHTALWLKGDDV